MKLKLDKDGHVVVQDGKPVYVHDDGKEVPFDAPAAVAKIAEVNEEAKKHRLKAKELQETVDLFKSLHGEEDPKEWAKKAEKALATVKNLDDKKLIEAGEVENLKKSISESYEKKLQEAAEQIKSKDSQIYKLMVSARFASSPFIAEKTTLTPDIAEARFANAFRIENLALGRYPRRIRLVAFAVPEIHPNHDEIIAVKGQSGLALIVWAAGNQYSIWVKDLAIRTYACGTNVVIFLIAQILPDYQENVLPGGRRRPVGVLPAGIGQQGLGREVLPGRRRQPGQGQE
ncbi:MAG: DUF6651 domain-containing protein, partial [candidate division WOR-3 bacterium]